jgi:hypothetical protein
MEEAPENSKELLHSAHASGLNENERQMYEYENGESVGLK